MVAMLRRLPLFWAKVTKVTGYRVVFRAGALGGGSAGARDFGNGGGVGHGGIMHCAWDCRTGCFGGKPLLFKEEEEEAGSRIKSGMTK
jgi:hypothetical protein